VRSGVFTGEDVSEGMGDSVSVGGEVTGGEVGDWHANKKDNTNKPNHIRMRFLAIFKIIGYLPTTIDMFHPKW
jgi:hypothetical protein